MNVQADRRAVARDVLRELIAEARRDQLHEQAKARRLRTLVRAGKAAGLGVPDLAAATNLSRPGIYELLKREGMGSVENLDEILLAYLGGVGASTPDSLAATLGVAESVLSESIERLAKKGAVTFASAGYDAESNQGLVMLGREGEMLLRQRMRRSLSSRTEGWVAYIAVPENQASELAEAAEARFGAEKSALIPLSTTFSMKQPELALVFDVVDEVELFNEAGDAWYALRRDLSLPPSPLRISAISPPRFRSPTVEALGSGIAKANPKRQPLVSRIVTETTSHLEEGAICVRALTEAATALRRAVGQERESPELAAGDDAFQELQAVVGLHLDPKREKIKEALIPGLERATDRLGPLPGGRMASFRAPGEAPRIVEEVAPTSADLMAIAEAAGEALGYADAATDGEIDVAKSLYRILSAEPNA